MAASYWQSTQHRRWEDSTAESSHEPRNDEEQALFDSYPLPRPCFIHAFLLKRIHQLAKKLNLRQIVSATAMVFVRRFYQKVQIRHTNPYLLITTAVYVAMKIEECPQHIKVVLSEARNMWPAFIQADTAKLGECEFRLISELNAQLIIHHPYQHLSRLEEHFQLAKDDLTTAWKVINDHYLTDLLFRYPPSTIAIAAVVLSVRPGSHRSDQSSGDQPGPVAAFGATSTPHGIDEKLKEWFVEGDVDVEGVMDCVQQMISLYATLETFPQSDEKCREQIGIFWKGQHLMSWAGGMQ